MWFDAQIVVYLGVILGISAGGCGSIFGVMASRFVRKRLHKKAVLTFATGLIFLGVASACIGIIALSTQQPYGVWYPCLVTETLLIAVVSPNYVIIKNIYSKLELNV